MPLIHLPKVVVFDFNGTLLDDLHVAYGSIQKIFKTYSILCPTLEQFRQEISTNFMEFYYRHGFPRTVTKDDLNLIRKEFYAFNDQGTQIRPDVEQTLDWLSMLGLRVAIVSGEQESTLYRYLLANGMQRKFDFIKAGASGGIGKKEEAFLLALDIFRGPPEKMIYIDDTVDGLTAAKNAGVIPVAFTNPTAYHSERRLLEVADVGIREIGELKGLLTGLNV